MFTISCRDVGRDCDCVVQGETEEELMKNAQSMPLRTTGTGRRDNDAGNEGKNQIVYS